MKTPIDTYIIEDSRLSWTAIGIYAFIRSRGDGWPVDDKYIIDCAGENESVLDVQNALKDLRKYGYLEAK